MVNGWGEEAKLSTLIRSQAHNQCAYPPHASLLSPQSRMQLLHPVPDNLTMLADLQRTRVIILSVNPPIAVDVGIAGMMLLL